MNISNFERIDPKLRDALSFFAIFVSLLFGSLALLLNPMVQRYFTTPVTVGQVMICQSMLRAVGAPVVSSGVVLMFHDGRGAVAVSGGCNAIEVSVIFAAAIFAFPAPFLKQAVGVFLGVASLQALNLLRIMSLLFLARLLPSLFDFFHLYVWDAFIMLDGVLLFLAWNHWLTRQRHAFSDR